LFRYSTNRAQSFDAEWFRVLEKVLQRAVGITPQSNPFVIGPFARLKSRILRRTSMVDALEILVEISDGFLHFVAVYHWALGHRRNCGLRAPGEGVENPNDIVAIFILVPLFDSKRFENEEIGYASFDPLLDTTTTK
jgi:hypothetical protein